MNASSEKKDFKYIYKWYILGIIVITIIFTILRIIGYADPNRALSLRDVDYKTLHDLLGYGVVEYYEHPSIGGFYALYLYYWCFMWYPFFAIPIEIGFYVWDVCRVIVSIYIAKNIYKTAQNRNNLVMFYILSFIGFTGDAYLNNTNWLIQILLFGSYIAIQKDKKFLSGILFVIALYKVNVLVFPIMLIIVRKINFKELFLYYILPTALMLIPYVIYPQYLAQMWWNWFNIEAGLTTNLNFILIIYLMFWQCWQTGQLMYTSITTLYLLENLDNLEKINSDKWRDWLRIIIPMFLLLLNLSFPLILWQIT